MVLNDAGKMMGKWYTELENKFKDIKCKEYIIMPNHCHAIMINTGKVPVGADLCVCPDGHRHGRTSGEHTGSPLHRVIQWFKTMTQAAIRIKAQGMTSKFHILSVSSPYKILCLRHIKENRRLLA